MTYPDPRYHGTTGETTATYRAGDAPPDLAFPGRAKVHYLATGATTGGKFGLYRWEMGGEPGGAEPHFHRSISESFYVLEGSVELFDGKSWMNGGPGDYVYVPEGGIHAFRNTSGKPATMLILFSPGAPREPYFEGLPRLGEMSEEEREAFFVEHDNIWV